MLEKFNIEKAELGNLIAGNSRGNFHLPREDWQDIFSSFLDKWHFDMYGYPDKKLENKYPEYLKTKEGHFEMFDEADVSPEELREKGSAYTDEETKMCFYKYNDKTYCIIEEVGDEFFKALEEFDDILFNYIDSLSEEDKIKYDAGEIDVPQEIRNKEPQEEDFPHHDSVFRVDTGIDSHNYFENDVFLINPYYWGDAQDIMNIPNFVYKPLGIEINWYKYPLRDAYVNKDLTFEEFKKIMEDCTKSIVG